MINKKMAVALNAQVNKEIWSAYLYLSMSLDAGYKGLKGVAHWFRKQYEEEMEHAFRLIDYLNLQMEKVELAAVDPVQVSWDCPRSMFRQAFDHEKKITACINDLYRLAMEEKDYATMTMLQWFITEQVEEESSVKEIADTLECIGNDNAALLMFDNSLQNR